MNRAERRRRTRVVKARARQPWRHMSWPWATRGAKQGIHEYANAWHRADRTRVRDALATIDTCDPDVDVVNHRPRNSAAWDLF